MVRPIFEYYTPATASTTGFATSVSGASFTLTSAATSDGLAHPVTITGLSATNLSAINVVITGIGPDGNSQTETLALPNGAVTVTSTLAFKSNISVVPASTTGAAAVSIGYSNLVQGRTIPADWQGDVGSIDVVAEGTINYTVQYTYDDIQNPNTARPYKWQSDVGPLTAATATASDVYSAIPMAWRMLINSYSAGATLQMTIVQTNHNQ